MKKLSYFILSVMLVLSCGFFAACGPADQSSITLSASNVSIYLGETENNTAIVNALPENVDVNLLDIVYDTTYINITQSQKLSDGSFNLTIVSKVEDFGTTTPIAVEVNAGDASAVFYVELVLPVTGITAESDTHVAYNGANTSINLLDCITFEPAGTKQTGVEFSLQQELSYAHIEGNYLVVDAGAEVNFVGGEIPSVKVAVNSTVEGKSSIGTEFDVKIVPNIQLLADVIDVKLNYNGADNIALENIDYNLSITKNETTGNYQISPFVVTISVPSSLGIEVDVDSQTGGGLSTNILNYLTYSKTISQNRTNPANVLDVYTFTFEANSTLQGEGYLRFNYKYSDYSNNEGLSASFVGVATDETLLEQVKVSVLMPITSISVETESTLNASDQYIIYQNYEEGIFGSAFAFVAMPKGTVQTDLVLVKAEDCTLSIFNSRGQLLTFEYNETTARLECPIQSGETFYVKGGSLALETLQCYSLAVGKEAISKEIVLNILEGGSGLGFVDDFDDAFGVETKTIYMQQDVPAEVLIYSPGATLVDFIYNANNVIVTNTEKTGYFKVTFNDLVVGEHTITISTVNGYSIQAIVNVVEPISSVNVTLGDNASHIAGVGYFVIENGDIINVSLENGYSALLNYVTNEGAKVVKLNYSFYEPNINVYDQKIDNLKNVTAENYLELNGISDADFVRASNYISTQNINLTNLLTATATGIVVVKINIYGQIVENNSVKEEIVATKYLYVEVYNSVKTIHASAKNISLRAENELDEDYKYLASTTIDISAYSSNNLTATYNKIYIDAGLYTVEPGAEGEEDIITSKFVKKISGKSIFEAIYDFNAKTITIRALYVDETIAGTIQTITLIAGDFINIKSGKTVFVEDFEDYNLKTFTINLTILQTSVVEDITVSNLTLESETETTFNPDGSVAVLGEKTYSTVYIDTSKSSTVIYKIYTELLPSTAFNKNLIYTFNPNSGYSQAMIDIATDGTVTILSAQGGTGVITIKPADSHSNARTVRIPIVVADGNSWATAYEISSLAEIIDTNKHYVLTNPTTYLLENTILKDLTFNGGLYGKRYEDNSNTYATIRLTGEPLFTMLGSNAKIQCLNICGDVNSKDQTVSISETENVEYNNGFIAFSNKGIISDVKVTTFVNETGVYVPSTLFVKSNIAYVGGLVGANFGTISNCTFAGSVNITNALANIQANAFVGVNNGVVEKCNVIIAKFSNEIDLNRIIADSDSDRTNKTETYYVNGVIDMRDGTRRINSLFDDIDNNKVAKKRYDGPTYVLDKNIFIRNNQGHSYGEANSLYGIVFYYKALNANKQNLIAELNTISFNNLFDFANLADDEEAKANVAKELKVSALNTDGTVCNYVNIGANTIELNGIGEFVVRITSEYDYTIIFEIRVLSVYYASEFNLDYNGTKLTSSDNLEIVYNQTREIVSSFDNFVSYKGNNVELYLNDYSIIFDLVYGENKVENPSKYITNNKIGTHTINMKFDWNDMTLVYASLDAGYGLDYNNMLDKIYGLTVDGNQTHLFNIQRKFGTTEIKTNLTDGEIEPSDTFEFEATLTTDVAEDYIAKLDNSGSVKGIVIFNQTNYDCTDYFNISVSKIDENLDGTVDLSDYAYKILISLNLNAFYGESGVDIKDFVNKKYTVVIYSLNTSGSDTLRYTATTSVQFTLLPQTISNITTSLYNVTTSTVAGVNVSESEISTSVIMPSQAGLFVIDMFPSYASFDYLEIIATSNTMSKLSFRLEEYDPSAIEAIEGDTLGWVANYRTVVSNSNVAENKFYEALSDQNGIRIFNNEKYNAEFYNAYANKFDNRPHLNNVNNIGKYFVKIFADTSFDTDTIFTITVNAYLNGKVLTAKSAFTLYMRMPEAPQLTIDGQTKVYKLVGEEIVADVLVSNDQVNFHPYLAHIEGENNSVLDGKSLSNINISYWQVSENEDLGYKRYKISIAFNKDTYDYTVDSTQLKLVVETTKIYNGKSLLVSSDVYIYMVDYLPEENDIQIFDAIDGVFNVTSLKETELKLADLTPKTVNATAEFIEQFNANYYFPVLGEGALESSTGFSFGKNKFTVNVGKETYTFENKAYVLASYLSYVNGDQKTALLNYYFDIDGNLVISHNKDDLNRVVFRFDKESGKLYVKGGDTTGRVEMSLEIQYKMPDNRYYTYEYRFAIVNSLYTTEDLPVEIANNTDFINIQNNDTAYDYILTKDLNLYDFVTIANTDKIKSLDGNNHTINIWNFAKVQSGTANLALFNQISATTTIKNLTVNLYYLSEIELGDAVTNAQVAGFALTNNGVIYNCEVLAYKSAANTSASSVLGIKMPKDVESTVAGFVINNVGSITNSRVGGESKLVTTINYIENDEGIVTDREVLQELVPTKQLSILASGTVSGFVVNNSGVIASSFVKNVNIQNTYYKQETRVTTGFVNNNTGTIAMSYAEGGFASIDEVQSSIGGLEGSGIMSGFVYVNNGTITDSYSNLMITNTRDQVGRLGAGFVFENAETGIIERCYSASKIIANNVTQMNFAGIKDFGGYNNYGTVTNSYYYIKDTADEITIESMMNTEINAVSVVGDDKNYYGFSFRTSTNAGTWNLSSHGPQIVSANDIAHSVRAKFERPDSVQSELNYIFVYCEGFELGSSNNPIIIRDAKEFNSVFGGSTSTDIMANYSNGKIYGAYRLANHIDMLELVPEEEQQTEYKVNLLSTKLVLTGEYNAISNRNGSFNGNGLSIKNLAISNSSTQSDSFGLFKSIENGASIANLNITLSSGGVTADHTVFVGTLAGYMSDSYAYNIDISAQDTKQSVKVIGANVVGGVFGRVIGSSYMSSISTNNISVTATYNSVSMSGGMEDNIENKYNLYNRKAAGYSDLSIAGGAFGVVDIYTKEQYEGGIVYSEQALDTNVQGISVQGGFEIEGMSAGGIFGYVGEYVVAKDSAFIISNDVIESKIIAYNYYAGGIAAYSEGYIYQAKAEHASSWQKEIESNYHSFYTTENRDNIDRGNLELFIDDIEYEQKAVGGLIGVLNGGKVTISYSKLNTIANSHYVGGAFGYVSGNYAERSVGDLARNALSISEVYASGDVYSTYKTGFIGGVSGYFSDAGASIDKINAVNYWGEQAYELFANTNTCFNVDVKSNGKQIAPIFNVSQDVNDNKIPIGDNGYPQVTIYSLKSVRFVNQEEKVFKTNPENSMQGYYDYQGVVTDNGAQVDLMFKQNGWYNNGNWSRETLEALPHIQYVNSSNILEIRSTADFHLFAQHGNDPDALFVVNGYERDVGTSKTKLIDCSGWQTSYAGFRASIVGATNEDGFENLNVTLFRTANSSSISNLHFKQCSAPLVNKSTSCSFKNLTYTGCTFTITTDGNLSGVTNMVSGDGSSFNSITFNDCRLTGSAAINAGFLFAESGDGNTNISITNVNIDNTATNSYNIVNKEYEGALGDHNYGLLFGSATCSVNITSVKLHDDMSVRFVNREDANDGTSGSINIGLIGGQVNEMIITLSEIELLPDSADLSKTGLRVVGPDLSNADDKPFNASVSFNIGGLVGYASNKLTIAANKDDANEELNRTSVYFAPLMSVKNIESATNLQFGTICGYTQTLELSGDALFILGQKSDEEKNVTFTSLEYDLAEASVNSELVDNVGKAYTANNNVGGIAGGIQELISSNGDPCIAYYGDIIAGAVKSTTKNTTLNLGGLFGVAGNSSGAILKNAFFDGTMNFDQNISKIMHLGGIVGYIDAENKLTMYNVVSSGEFVLSKQNEKGENIDIELVNDNDHIRYAAGLVGFVDGTLIVGSDGIYDDITGKYYYYKTSVLTTIYTRKNYSNIDAFVNLSSTGNIVIKFANNVSLAQYSSTLTLCTSALPHDDIEANATINVTGYLQNYPYGEIISSLEQGTNVIESPIFTTISSASTFNGTKLNPYILTKSGVVTNDTNRTPLTTVELNSPKPSSIFYAVQNGKLKSLISTSNRKLYVMVKDDVQWISEQYALQNTILFSDGAAIYAGVTPFDTVDNRSAISGIIAKVYIQTTHENYTEKGFETLDCYAGFVNHNSGIIYTCSVQECMNNTNGMNNSTQFYGYFSNTINIANDKYVGYGAFVALNDGYIFGSSANMKFAEVNNISASGFVANNRETGVIAYCYASGENHTKSGNLFTQQTEAEYRANYADFKEWLGLNSTTDDLNINSFWDNIVEETLTTENKYNNKYSLDVYEYEFTGDFANWLLINGAENDENLTWIINKDIEYHSENADIERINLELYDRYCLDVVNSDNPFIKQKHDESGNTIPDFLGEYQNCYSIVMSKGLEYFNIEDYKKTDGSYDENAYDKEFKNAHNGFATLPSGVYSEELANECKASNSTILYNATSLDVKSDLILDDSKNYYNCDPDYNWNYPTITGSAFKNFDFLKRNTLCVYDIQTESYETKDMAYVTNLIAGSESLLGYDIKRDTQDQDASGNDYFKKVFYVQIPNLTILKHLQEFIDGLDMTGEGVYKYQYSKFVVISNLNFGYKGSILLDSSDFIGTIEDNNDNPTKIEIDGYNRTFKNLNLRSANLINKIQSNGQQIEIRKLVFDGISLNESTGIINEITNNVTIKLINFVQSQSVNYIAPNYAANQNVVGILVSRSAGTISESKFGAILNAVGTSNNLGGSKTSYTIGAFVGQNTGTIVDCEFSGTVQIIETKQNVNVIFGCFAGENGASGTGGVIKSCLIKEGNSKMYYLSEGGSIYLSKEDNNVESDPILTTTNEAGELSEIEMKAQIYVSTNGEATVGGIAGKHTRGKIEQCLTFASPTSSNVTKNYGILVGDEEYQIKALAGGIAGEINYGIISDSANRMNIGALAVWLFTTNEDNSENYKYKITEDEIVVGTGNINDKTLGIYYADADPTPIFKFNNNSLIYVYREMTSLAYAGGIVGYGLKTAAVEPTAENNARLINYGEVNGGYRAIKPVATITATISDTSGQAFAFWGGFAGLIAGSIVGGINVVNVFKNKLTLANVPVAFGSALLQAAIKAQTIWQWIGIGAAALSFADMWAMFEWALSEVSTPTFATTAIMGNSLNYYLETDFVNLMCNSGSGYNDKDIKKALIDAIDVDNHNFPADYHDLVGSNANGAYSMFWLSANLEGAFEKNNIKGNTKVSECSRYYEILEEYWNVSEGLNIGTLLGVDKPLKNYLYDGICPTLIIEEDLTKPYQIYSKVKNFSAEKTLKSGNLENNYLVYNNVDKLYLGLEQEPTEELWSENFSYDENGYFVPSVGLKAEITPNNIDSLSQDGYALYKITNPSQWEDVVYTINKRSLDITNSDPNYANYYLNAQIEINFKGGYEYLEIEDNTLNTFNGKIISSTDYKFTNIVLKNKGTNSFGLIKESYGAELKNITIKGIVTVSKVEDDSHSNPEINGAILIGKIGTLLKDVTFTQINISIDAVEFDSNALSKISHFGGLVGNIDDACEAEPNNYKVTVKNVNVNTEFKASTSAMIAGDYVNDTTNLGFGTIAGKVSDGNLIIDNVKLSGSIELGTNFNRVGGFVGIVDTQGRVTFGESSENETNMYVKVASKANTSAGGVIGYNIGTVNISRTIKLGKTKTLLITADVVSFEYYATAGGVFGYNNGVNNIIATIEMGRPTETYAEVGYILAGYNQVDLYGVATAFPRQDGTSVGIFAGNSNETSLIFAENIIARFIASDISDSSSFIQYFGEKYSANSSAKWTGLINAIKSTSLEKTEDDGSKSKVTNYNYNDEIKFNINNGDLTSDFSYSVSEKNESGSYKLTYSYNQVNDFNVISTDNNLKTYQWLLNIHYEAQTKEQGVSTSEMKYLDGSVKDANKISLDYKFIVRLVSSNAKLDDNGIYTLQVIKLNDYIRETSDKEVVYKTDQDVPVVDEDGNDTGETQKAESTSYVEIVSYTENTSYIPTVIYSKKINMTNYTSQDYTVVTEIKDAIDLQMVAKYAHYERKEALGTSISTTTEFTSVKLNTKSFNVAVKLNSDNNWEFAFNENYDIEIAITKTSSSTVASGSMTDYDWDNMTEEEKNNAANSGNGTSSSSSRLNLSGKGTYTRTLFNQVLKNTKVETTLLDYKGTKPVYDYEVFAVEGAYHITTNSGVQVSFDSNSIKNNTNVALVDSDTLSYTGNFSLANKAINVVYTAPKYMYDNNEYTKVNIYKFTIEDKNYIIASCVSEGNIVLDYIYLITETNQLKSCGTISYMLSTTDNNTTLDSVYTECLKQRYSSFFPVLSENTTISGIQNNVTEPASIGRNYVEFDYQYYSTKTIIEVYEFYSKTITVKTPMICKVRLTSDKVEFIDEISVNENKTTDSQSNITYYSNEYELSGLVNVDDIAFANMLEAKNYTDEQKSLYQSNFVRFEKADINGPAMAVVTDNIENLIELKEDETLKYFYVYKSKIVGFVSEYKTLTGSGETVGWRTYYRMMHPGVSATWSLNSAQYEDEIVTRTETSETGETQEILEVVGRNCVFYIFDKIDTSYNLPVVVN